jgi:hypothetical protein
MNAYSEAQTSGNSWAPLAINGRAYYKDRQMASFPSAILSKAPENVEREMLQFEFDHEKMVEQLGRNYVMPTDCSVTNFLKSHRVIHTLLLAAAPQLKKYFGDSAVVSLSLSADDSGDQTLFGVVKWPGTLDAAESALNGFDNEWWLSRVNHASGYLSFTYELR